MSEGNRTVHHHTKVPAWITRWHKNRPSVSQSDLRRVFNTAATLTDFALWPACSSPISTTGPRTRPQIFIIFGEMFLIIGKPVRLEKNLLSALSLGYCWRTYSSWRKILFGLCRFHVLTLIKSSRINYSYI